MAAANASANIQTTAATAAVNLQAKAATAAENTIQTPLPILNLDLQGHQQHQRQRLQQQHE